MRKKQWLGGLVILSLGLLGWVTWGTAQPSYNPTPVGKSSVTRKIIERTPQILPDDEPIVVLPPVSNVQPKSAPPLIVDPLGVPIHPTRLAPEPLLIPMEPERREEERPNRGGTPPPQYKMPLSELPDIAKPEQPLRSESTHSTTQPAIAMEWTGPATVKVGQTGDYTLLIRNTSTIPVQKVIVQARVPAEATVVSTEPKAEGADGVMLWELGNLLAKQERKLTIRMKTPNRGDVNCQAWVTFTGSSVMKIRVREPKLTAKIVVPEKTVVGEPVNVVLSITNSGDHPAEQVKIAATLGDGLETIRGNKLSYDLGTLAPGDSRNLTVPCITKNVGAQKCELTAEADLGLKAHDVATINVVQPRLDLTLVGPKLRYLDRKAVYTIRVTNPGDAAASNVFVTQTVPAGFKFVQADMGGQHDDMAHSIKWFVGELPPGQAKEVKCELLAIEQGEFTHKVTAHASRGMKAGQELKTAVEGLSAILMELVDVEDPVEVGGETAYEIKITNTGSKAETDVKLICTIPPQLKLKSVNAPLKYEMVGNDLVFQSLPKLSPRADVVFKIVVTAEAKGDARFKASLTSASLVEPVVKVEPTKVYAE